MLRGWTFEGLVADQVAEAVVDALEVVDVDHADPACRLGRLRAALVGAPDGCNLACLGRGFKEAGVEGLAIQQARQGVALAVFEQRLDRAAPGSCSRCAARCGSVAALRRRARVHCGIRARRCHPRCPLETPPGERPRPQYRPSSGKHRPTLGVVGKVGHRGPGRLQETCSLLTGSRPRRSGGRASRRVVADQGEQVVFGVRFAEVVVNTQFGSVVAMLLRDARRDHDHRQAAQTRVAADVAD